MEQKKFGPKTYLGITTENTKIEDLQPIFDEGYKKIYHFAQKNSIELTGPPVGLYWNFDMNTGTMNVLPGAEVAAGTSIPSDSEFTIIKIPESNTLMDTHIGSYDGLKNVHDNLMKHLMQNSLKMGTYTIEVYVTDPMKEKDTSKWVTEVYYQLS